MDAMRRSGKARKDLERWAREEGQAGTMSVGGASDRKSPLAKAGQRLSVGGSETHEESTACASGQEGWSALEVRERCLCEWPGGMKRAGSGRARPVEGRLLK